MSDKIIHNLIQYFCKQMNVLEENIIIKESKVENDCNYEIELEALGNKYSILHMEPLNPVPGVNYGHGPYYSIYEWKGEKQGYCLISNK
jgi:hypothetical protein